MNRYDKKLSHEAERFVKVFKPINSKPSMPLSQMKTKHRKGAMCVAEESYGMHKPIITIDSHRLLSGLAMFERYRRIYLTSASL